MNIDCVIYLSSWTNAINAQNEEGSTPLHLAVENYTDVDACRKQSMIKGMLFQGASRDIKDLEGKTPMDMIPDESIHEIN